MKYFFMFLGCCGALMVIAAVVALFIGAPPNQKVVIKTVEIERR